MYPFQDIFDQRNSYRIRGAKTVVFYSLPEHLQFYSELLASPFLPPTNTAQTLPDEGEVSSQVLFSRLDAMRLRRVVGDANAKKLCEDETTSKFTFLS